MYVLSGAVDDSYHSNTCTSQFWLLGVLFHTAQKREASIGAGFLLMQ